MGDLSPKESVQFIKIDELHTIKVVEHEKDVIVPKFVEKVIEVPVFKEVEIIRPRFKEVEVEIEVPKVREKDITEYIKEQVNLAIQGVLLQFTKELNLKVEIGPKK